MQASANEPVAASASQRILSVDVLRGFDMFWLIGANPVAISICEFFGPTGQQIVRQLRHTEWEGFTFRDLIFPLFVFLVGMSTVFSLSKILAQQGKRAVYRRLIRRSVLLYLLGVLYHGGLSNCWPNIWLVGVLQRIALCYLFTGILCIHCRLRGVVIALVALLVGYWALLSFVPVPGVAGWPEGRFADGTNWAYYVDSKWMPNFPNNGVGIAEGLLSTLPAVASCLLGVLAAHLLRNQKLSEGAKVGCLIGGGVLVLLLGFAWGIQFPVIKKLWTSSYVLVAGGYSYLLLGILYLVVDVWKLQRWSLVFLWIGGNAITLYMASRLIDFDHLARLLVGGDIQVMAGKAVGALLINVVHLILTLALARFLYQRKIFLRV